ncbi:5-formyltetrahydrofolate cyclo-ligase protein [Marine Group I thaumarchaeote SCGC AAA799-O18]|nr:5-formyltetrahydrofolate cyclo-ligase protein [Marine Group I thaumarchaeote SCGC AAA799-O18]
MSVSVQKAALRKHLLEKRDATSAELRNISSKKIYQKLKRVDSYINSQNIACYFPIGSEVDTNNIMLDILERGKNMLLPKIVDNNLEFYSIPNLEKLEKGRFDIMEPKDSCKKAEKIDCILVPTVGISKSGDRLGYGSGYYDKFLSFTDAVKISLTYSKQIVKSIPSESYDIKIDLIITEDEIIKIS